MLPGDLPRRVLLALQQGGHAGRQIRACGGSPNALRFQFGGGGGVPADRPAFKRDADFRAVLIVAGAGKHHRDNEHQNEHDSGDDRPLGFLCRTHGFHAVKARGQKNYPWRGIYRTGGQRVPGATAGKVRPATSEVVPSADARLRPSLRALRPRVRE